MKKLLLFIGLASLISCNSRNTANSNNAVEDSTVEANSYSEASEVADNGGKESLNDIRFAGWGKAEWVDNEYIRTVRRYLDAYNNGEIIDTELDEYKDDIQGKFIIGDIQPWMLGGAIIYIVFCDHPEKLFYSVVYSYVDEQTREVYDYECRGIRLETAEYGSSQDEIEQFLKDCPEHKMW